MAVGEGKIRAVYWPGKVRNFEKNLVKENSTIFLLKISIIEI